MKSTTLYIPEFEGAFSFNWQDNKKIKVSSNDSNEILIVSNKEGLISLANHLLNLAQDTVPNYYHIHLDDSNSLEEGSVELIIEKDNDL